MYGPLILIRCYACIFRLFGKKVGLFPHKCEHSVKHKRADVSNFQSFSQDVGGTSAPVLDAELSPRCNYVFSLVKKLPVSTGFLVTSVGLTLHFIDNALLPFSCRNVWNKTSTSDWWQLILSYQIWHALLEIQSHLLDNLHLLWHDFTTKLICSSTAEGRRCFMPANGARPVSHIQTSHLHYIPNTVPTYLFSLWCLFLLFKVLGFPKKLQNIYFLLC